MNQESIFFLSKKNRYLNEDDFTDEIKRANLLIQH